MGPGPVDKRHRRDDGLGLHGVLSSLPLYFPYSRLSSTIFGNDMR
jgi:hypothetical protein